MTSNVMEFSRLKSVFLDNVKEWSNNMVDNLVNNHPHLKVASPYLKRGIKNMIAQEDRRINQALESVALFVCDEDGNIDVNGLFDDVLGLFRDMEESPWALGVIKGTIGKGKIRISVPNNVLTSVLFGDTGAVVVTADDIMELKRLISEDVT